MSDWQVQGLRGTASRPDVPSSDQDWPDNMPLEEQIERLGNYILGLDAGYPNRSAGACETAVQIIGEYRAAFEAIRRELGVPGPEYPAPVSNAHTTASDALSGAWSRRVAE